MSAQPTLFPAGESKAPLCGGESKAPLCSSSPGKRGRGATPPVQFAHTLPRPNPAGRLTLSYDFRPLKRHQVLIEEPATGQRKEVWRVACNLLADYFARIGGFRVADDEIVRLWADAVLSADYGPRRIAWALAAKAASLTSDDPVERSAKRVFASHPARFIARTRLDYWIDQSPQGRAESAADAQRRIAAKLDDLKASGSGPHPGPQAPAPSAAPAAAEYPPFIAAALAAAEQRFARRLWEVLSEARRRVVDGILQRNAADYTAWFAPFERDGDAADYQAIRFHLRAVLAQERWPEADFGRLRAEMEDSP